MMDDTIQIKCGRCAAPFRERARKIVNGYSRQCPGCEAVIFFDEDSPKAAIKDAMQAAKSVRRALRESAEDKLIASKPYVHSRN